MPSIFMLNGYGVNSCQSVGASPICSTAFLAWLLFNAAELCAANTPASAMP